MLASRMGMSAMAFWKTVGTSRIVLCSSCMSFALTHELTSEVSHITCKPDGFVWEPPTLIVGKEGVDSDTPNPSTVIFLSGRYSVSQYRGVLRDRTCWNHVSTSVHCSSEESTIRAGTGRGHVPTSIAGIFAQSRRAANACWLSWLRSLRWSTPYTDVVLV